MNWMFFLREGGCACCWRRRWVLKTCTCDDLSTITHPLQHRSSELDRQGPGDTECVWVLVQFLSSGKGVRLGLVALDDLSTTTHPLQYRSSELVRQGPGDTECVWVLVQFLQAGPDLAILGSLFDRMKGSPFWEGAPLLRGRAPLLRVHAPFGRACSTLTTGWEKGAPLLKGRAPFRRAYSTLTTGWEKGAPLLKGRAHFGRARPFWKGAHLLKGRTHSVTLRT